jgi:hypothetical protein
MPKLMPRICLRHGLCPLGHAGSRQNCNTMLALQRFRIQSQFPRQFHIHLHKPRRRNRCWVQSRVKVHRQPRICVVKVEANLLATQGARLRRNRGVSDESMVY